MLEPHPLKVFVGTANPQLGAAICSALQTTPGKGEVIHFREGNTMVRVLENVRGCDTYIIQGTHYPVNDNFMELLFWIDALKRASAHKVTAIMPFFSYAKGDKKDEPRVAIRAKVCAEALEAVGVDRIVTLDLHSPQIEGFFRCPVNHLYGRPILARSIAALDLKDLVIASADVGFGKGAYKLAAMLECSVAIGNKIRHDHSEAAEIWQVVGDVKNKNVVIVDDIIFSGGTLVQMAHALKNAGARKVFAAVSHGVFSQGAQAVLDQSPIERLITTDSVEYEFDPPSTKSQRVTIAPLVAKAIESIHNNKSISALSTYSTTR